MKISIITISFNQKPFLKECIDSILSQNYPDFEYIVVDPGSTDGSRELIDSYGPRITKIFEPDLGPADGLNKGFNRATGEVLCYVNSDDFLLPGALASAAANLQTSRADIVYGHANIVNENSVLKRTIYSDRFDLTSAAYGSCIIIQPSSFFLNSAYLSTNGFNAKNKSNWDDELFVEMALSGKKFKLVNEIWSAYRVHNESITGTGKLAALHSQYRARIFEKILGKPYSERSRLLEIALKIRRKLVNYRDTIQRIINGPVFMSKR
ncbi:MAG: glycosyltransferase [Gammaproteobacteria bacterium]|uniref:glycosyltransferase family 2 protein n=1 Tax=Hydrogenophaga sp. TaxID=1904254 RepID=UPI0025BBF9DA|nr:glycosyltransferase family 2 protein [Hydrogenophaga sp.]MBU4181727.1 glycosyltransferase [Gammaproteobacteria bacterium]MBU4279888.1 glycosyltransferase [Gammaproteobacteria bacterium]MCG2658330.1 glycosyltransferase [Hydrogenophaga sp.]